MLGLFNKKQSKDPAPEWIATLEESKERWFIFLDKLEIKIEELCTSAIPELKELMATDEDVYKRTFGRVYSGVNGQLENIRKKARETLEEKILGIYDNIKFDVSVQHPYYNNLSDFRSVCHDRHNNFEKKYQYWNDQLEKTREVDLEIDYQKIVQEYDAIKNKFNCKQCGGNITIEKIFFITTYISCSHCQTQNTFEPSTQSRMLLNFAKQLAEQRTAHLYELYSVEKNKERELYHERHELSLTRIHEKNKQTLDQKAKEMEDLEKRRQEAIVNAPKLYHSYLRAMFDELNKITPDLKEHNEKLYNNQIN